MQTLIKWTVDDYHRIVEAGILADRRVELLAGDIHQMAPEGPPHSYYGGSFADRLREDLAGRALVREARPITLADSEPEPDIAVVQGGWERYRDRHPEAVDVLWVIEVSESSLKKDTEDKRIIYATAEITDYWVWDLTTPQLIIYRNPQAGDYQSVLHLQQGDIAPLAFPDLIFSVGQLLA
ncbi:MAG: Uma2 family endonuclease [Leptolyngbyaceae cyanobacterium MO_188.B28]|nr:Uma2 family endonuclease [Leptolyngbyaceae cyanobacterium MO_188.B28]